ncbi:MAG: tetratricopeptide repeat protein [Myxococcota bacterium]|nr:tetratricopeptide repeat protein [Myxococcota bacterium]
MVAALLVACGGGSTASNVDPRGGPSAASRAGAGVEPPRGSSATRHGTSDRESDETRRTQTPDEEAPTSFDLPLGLPVEGSARDQPPRLTAPPPAIETLEAAEAAERRGHRREAEAFYARVVARGGPERARAELGLARVAFARGRHADALAAAGRAARAAAHREAAELLRAEVLMRVGRADEARPLLESLASSPRAVRAWWLLGRLHAQAGRTDESARWFMRLVRAYNDGTIGPADAEGLALVGSAAAALGAFRDANDAFREATRADPTRVETQIEWARLFLEKHDPVQAEQCLRAALEHDPESAPAHALMGRVVLERGLDLDLAERYALRALEIDPSHVPAWVLRASIAVREQQFEAAHAALERALAIDPTDAEAWSTRAAAHYVADEREAYEAARAEVLGRNPSYTRLYAIVAEHADWAHRYADVVALAREAVRIAPDDAVALSTLGLGLLRIGQETEGLEALRRAWRRDRYNVRVYNTLELFEGAVARDYETRTDGGFVLRLHRAESPVLARLVPPLLREARDAMTPRYGPLPQGAVHVELYADPEHFAVRTSGLPHVGVQGVCFGRVLAALSPRGGPYAWALILWHELSHVFHVELSRHRVPRWFTEGLAELETARARPEWRRRDPVPVAHLVDRMPPLHRLDRAFLRARSAAEMMFAYQYSLRVVEWLGARFGEERLVEMLRAWGRGLRTERVIREVLGVEPDALDQQLREQLRRESAPTWVGLDPLAAVELDALIEQARQAPSDSRLQARLAAGFAQSGREREALEAARRALDLNASEPTALLVVGMLRRGPEAERSLRAILEAGRDGPDVRLALGARLLEAGKPSAAREQLEAAVRLAPDRLESWRGLLLIGRRLPDRDLQDRALERLAALDPHDRAVHVAWVQRLLELERWDPLLEAARRAQHVAPHDAIVHEALGRAALALGRHAEAVEALELALLVDPGREATLRPLLDRARRAAGQARNRAESHAQTAGAAATR